MDVPFWPFVVSLIIIAAGLISVDLWRSYRRKSGGGKKS